MFNLPDVTIDDSLIKLSENWADNLGEEYTKLIHNWTGSAYRRMNTLLTTWLEGETHDHDFYSSDYDEDKLADFLMALSLAPKFDGLVYRGTNKTSDKFEVGQTLDLARLTSWSINPNAAKTFAGKTGVIYVTKASGYYIDGASTFGRRRDSTACEDEVILSPVTATVTNIEKQEHIEKTTRHSAPQKTKRQRATRRRSHNGARFRRRLQREKIVTPQGTNTRIIRGNSRITEGKIKRAYDGYHWRGTPQVKTTVFETKTSAIVTLECTENWSTRKGE